MARAAVCKNGVVGYISGYRVGEVGIQIPYTSDVWTGNIGIILSTDVTQLAFDGQSRSALPT